MSKNLAEYSVQPAYNDSFQPPAPPSYAEATASSYSLVPRVNQLPYPKQVDSSAGPPPSFISQPVHGQPETNYTHATQFQPPTAQSSVVVLPIGLAPPQLPVGPQKAHLQCPHCRAQICTETKTTLQKSAYIAFCLLCLFGCYLCCCIPCCMKSFKNVHHHCPLCRGFIGTYKG